MKPITKICISVYIALSWVLLPAMGNTDPAPESKVQGWIKNMDNAHTVMGQAGGGLRFMENRGQLTDMQDGHSPVNNRAGGCIADMNLLFKASGAGADIYITTWGLSYVFTKMEKSVIPELNSFSRLSERYMKENERTAIQYCRADMELVGADIKKENIKKEYESEDRTDYYLPVCLGGITNVHSYERITINNIYPGIDWVLYSSNQQMKYDFVVHPGADPSLIRLRYKWTDKPQLQNNGSVKIKTPIGNITEGVPVSYLPDNMQKINTRYEVRGNEIGFVLDKYSKSNTLIIDPTLVWATYYGGGNSSEVSDTWSMNTDGVNVWVLGSSQSAGFPTQAPTGAYLQGIYKGGGQDLTILEFSTCGTLVWATYYGGSSLDYGYSISSDGNNVWITGWTLSTDFPCKNLASGYNQSSLKGVGGAGNAFILQFSCATDARVWASYYGGSGGGAYPGDIGYSICSDGVNVWVTGEALSTDFPTKNLAGAYNRSSNAGSKDVFISQFSCAGSNLIWASCYGGSKDDEGYSISSDGKSVWLTGVTSSTDFPSQVPTGLAYSQPNENAVPPFSDAFILQFSCNSSVIIWATYYAGRGVDQGNSISSDGNNVWVTGLTTSADFPTENLPGAYNQPGLGQANGNAFILQFSCATAARIWATYYGGSGGGAGVQGDIGYSIQSDGANVWVSGETMSTDFPIKKSSCGFFQDTLGSKGLDVFILQFNNAGARQWATYYGSDIEQDGNYICSDGNSIFVSGDATSINSYPTKNYVTGAHFEGTNSGSENMFVGKFSVLCSTTILSATGGDSICPGGSVTLTAGGASTYSWSPLAGLSSIAGSSVTASPAHTTTYTVTGTDGCGATTTTTITVMVLPGINVKASQLFPTNCNLSDGSAEVTATGGTGMLIYSWSNLIMGVANNNIGAGTYTVTVTDTKGCSGTSSATIQNSNGPNPSAEPVNTCIGKTDGTITITGTAVGDTYAWSTGFTTQNINALSPGTYTVTVTDGTGCTGTASATILQFPNPLVSITKDTSINKGRSVQLTASGGINFAWTPSTGLSDAGISDPVANPLQTTTYTVLITDPNACTAIDSVRIIVKDTAIVDCDSRNVFVPTAFSPNGDGQNDILYVRGALCATQLHFQLFDRWGEVVFETTNPATGWDGTFKGKTMETGVFAYYLTAILSNGQNINRRGNVTLFR